MKALATVGLALVTIALAACTFGAGSTPSPTPPSSSPIPDPSSPPSASPSPTPSAPLGLDGRTFLSVAVTVDDEPFALVPDTRIRITFADSTLGANAGCNHLSGSYTVDDDRLMVGSLATTEMGCEEALMDQDEWLANFLGSNPTFVLDGNDLTLTSGSTVINMLDREEADPDQALTGTTWQLTTIFSGGPDGAAVSIPEGVTSTIVFNDDGTVNVRPGCNNGRGDYTVDGTTITFGPIALTRMACPGAAGQVENDVLVVLGVGPVEYTIEASTLTLQTADGGLQYTAQ